MCTFACTYIWRTYIFISYGTFKHFPKPWDQYSPVGYTCKFAHKYNLVRTSKWTQWLFVCRLVSISITRKTQIVANMTDWSLYIIHWTCVQIPHLPIKCSVMPWLLASTFSLWNHNCFTRGGFRSRWSLTITVHHNDESSVGMTSETCVASFRDFEKAAITDNANNVQALVKASYQVNSAFPLSVEVVYHVNSSNGTGSIISVNSDCPSINEVWLLVPSPVFIFTDPTSFLLNQLNWTCTPYTLSTTLPTGAPHKLTYTYQISATRASINSTSSMSWQWR